MSLSRNDSFAGTLIILEHPAAVYRFSRALDIYHMKDARFYDFSTYLTTGENAISYKLSLLRGLASFPYIKKVEIPINFRLIYPSIYKIIETVIRSRTP
jgi:hypothetical protein